MALAISLPSTHWPYISYEAKACSLAVDEMYGLFRRDPRSGGSRSWMKDKVR